MINPDYVTNFNRTVPELEEFLLFSVAAAGKDGWLIARALQRFLKATRQLAGKRLRPFGCISYLNNVPGRETDDGADLAIRLKNAGFGCFNGRARSFTEIVEAQLDLRNCDTWTLQRIHGISFKTSRLFILHSREGQNLIPIDRHMLRYAEKQPEIKQALEELGFEWPNDPPSSPTAYLALERVLVEWAQQKMEMTCAEFDIWVWRNNRKKHHFDNVRNLQRYDGFKFKKKRGKRLALR